ncbi:amidase family protein [Burkholderia sp. SIMBA_043]|uniref:amidase n=1 Tax=Burkholderia TaxID=32008 RepID=UPI0005D9663B|nr:amidase family protein [Burkholderia vietnamiensis]AJY04343.1 amidase family protein [Burkholderia vietnamiensis LMG 10929]AVR12819.1 amidase [Burkholderia vietnamiensis]KVM55482.1 amidase [Burkholderia vietnamiensis]KVR97856.1 amidase [Burkholderia vietnamiensis]UBI25101.1 amidase [Burkholderia vietnamiensis]
MSDRHELTRHSAVALRALLLAREISAVELLDACIARIETLNPYVNAITATSFERARREARAADAALARGNAVGVLHGLPVGIKDLEETEGLLTTYGSPLYRANIPAQDNTLVRRLRAAGAIVVGKTNVPEMGAGANSFNPVWGATGNPFDPRLNAGGSSGGSAAALALDMVPLASGSDTGGSLRIPAAKCGVVGLRTSPGLVPSDRKPLGWTPNAVVGPMGRTVEDTWLQLAATVGQSGSDPLGYPCALDATMERRAHTDLATLRVGYTEDFGVCAVDDDIRAVFRRRIALLRGEVAVCEPIDVDFSGAHQCFDVLRAEAFVAGLQKAYETNPDLLGPNPRANYEMGINLGLADCVRAHADQTRLFRRFQTLFDRYDVILSPTTPVSPFRWTQPYLKSVNGIALENYYRWLSLTYVVTLTTNPAVSLPCGVDHRGMPFGLQMIGAFRGDLALLDAARAFETLFESSDEMRRPIPDVAKLRASDVDLRSIVTHPPVLDAASSSHACASAV